MILRRMIEHVRTQNWTAIGIDFVIVVVGVFIGIQVANWNAWRQERNAERETLIRLHEDISKSIAGQDRDLRFYDAQLADQAVILASLNACEVMPEDDLAFQRGITELGYLNPPRLYRRTIDEIAASGRTDIIRNADLAAELAQIVELVEWRGSGVGPVNDIVLRHRYDVEHRVRHDLSQVIADDFIPEHRAGIEYDIEALCALPVVAAAVSTISYVTHERLEAYRPILDAYRAFLPRIEEELEQRWGVTVSAQSSDQTKVTP
ncbi:MAG: hypothetical protein AAF742_00390 [Pseudomonadota bacterium]